MSTITTLRINGTDRSVATDGGRSLLEVLREEFDLTGSKYGCGEGECGACTVLVDGAPKRSCLTSLSTVAGKEITTSQGLATGGKIHPVQEAFLAENAFQCGYCTPGLILSLAGLLKKKPIPSDAELILRLEGHLCRCCAYPNIIKAIGRAAAQARH